MNIVLRLSLKESMPCTAMPCMHDVLSVCSIGLWKADEVTCAHAGSLQAVFVAAQANKSA